MPTESLVWWALPNATPLNAYKDTHESGSPTVLKIFHKRSRTAIVINDTMSPNITF
ncbi:hypothetical protein NUACC26_100140 [Scytonema sp. NUACC26]